MSITHFLGAKTAIFIPKTAGFGIFYLLFLLFILVRPGCSAGCCRLFGTYPRNQDVSLFMGPDGNHTIHGNGPVDGGNRQAIGT